MELRTVCRPLRRAQSQNGKRGTLVLKQLNKSLGYLRGKWWICTIILKRFRTYVPFFGISPTLPSFPHIKLKIAEVDKAY
jgi:hypothetical protein